jgi:signal transduction histidine kinase
MTAAAPIPDPTVARAPRLAVWRYVGRLAPLVLLWIGMAGLLGWLLYSRASWNDQSDRADISEWIDNTRIFRKTLAELVKEYVDLLSVTDPGADHAKRLRTKRAEIEEHIRAMTEPTRIYSAQLPLFPEVYRLEVEFSGVREPSGQAVAPLQWDSPKPKPGGSAQGQLRTLEFEPFLGRTDAVATIRVEYRLHTYNRMQREHDEYRFWQTLAAAVLLPTTLLAMVLVIRFLQRERRRELDRWQSAVAAEHRERELLQSRIKQQEAEHAREELGRKVLEQQLDAARLESRAAEAENAALQLRSELYASIGIMAGSYAHNIKNLLVRPNDLLARCLESDGVSHEQQGMLQEVKSTLGTVTERLQQILRTVRRDPASTETTRVDLAALVAESQRTWVEMGREKWKLTVTADIPREPVLIDGDLSHLQQAVENLLFNARDATFEMRNYLRDEAKREPDAALRRQKLLDAAAWRGKVGVRLSRDGDRAVLEVQDNGIGMTEEVRRNCLKTHFTTKRDNALYEGYSAGMGLGLSFVAMVLEHHGAELEIESAPLRGTTFRVKFPLAHCEPAASVESSP